jgi:hypothetical protein
MGFHSRLEGFQVFFELYHDIIILLKYIFINWSLLLLKVNLLIKVFNQISYESVEYVVVFYTLSFFYIFAIYYLIFLFLTLNF